MKQPADPAGRFFWRIDSGCPLFELIIVRHSRTLLCLSDATNFRDLPRAAPLLFDTRVLSRPLSSQVTGKKRNLEQTKQGSRPSKRRRCHLQYTSFRCCLCACASGANGPFPLRAETLERFSIAVRYTLNQNCGFTFLQKTETAKALRIRLIKKKRNAKGTGMCRCGVLERVSDWCV